MRTKTLLLTAVLSAAGLASSLSLAQGAVYSVNAVGYVNLPLPVGLSLICNPLKGSTGNDLNTILPLTDADVGATIYTYNGSAFVSTTYLGTSIGWTPNNSVAPGQGMFISLGAAKTLTFVGEVPQGTDSNIHMNNGLSLVAPPVPQSSALDTMLFPADVGDTVYFYRGGSYASSTFLGPGIGWTPAAVPGVGEGFWVSRANAADWNRNFSVNN